MLKFTAGLIVGWTAARALPPPKNNSDRMKPPTSDEIYILAQKMKKATEHIIKKLDNPSSS